MKKVPEILNSDKYLNNRFFGSGVIRRTILGKCNRGKYLKFAAQSPELIAKFDRKLEGLKCG